MSTLSSFLFRRTVQYYPIRQLHLSRCIYQDRYFSKQHEWVQLIDKSAKANEVRIGISDYAQRALGDVVYCELPTVGAKFKRDDTFATLESVKAVSDCYMPIEGEISSVNESLKKEADLINKSPYEKGWLVQAVIDEKTKNSFSSTLMTEKQYNEFLEATKAADH